MKDRNMRTMARKLAWIGLVGAGMATYAGCGTAYDDFYLELTNAKYGTSTSTGTGTSTSSSTTGTGGAPPSCEGDPTTDPSLVRDECGVFVQASAAAGGKGTKTSPFQTFEEAAGAADVKRIYACAETYAETAPIVFTGGVEIYAGFTECDKQSGWSWTAASKASLTGPADMVSLTLTGGANHIENMNVTALNASIPGGSAVAMLVSGGSLDMSAGSVTAGDAMAGSAGMSLMDDPLLDGDSGDGGVGICSSAANNVGPTGKNKSCTAGDNSTAGNGGDGGEFMMSLPQPAGSGTDGNPPDGAQPTDGKGGLGEGEGAPVALVCKDGTSGVPGSAGDSGDGATGYGAVNAKDIYQGLSGKDGTSGKPGQGGGGGGGAKGAKAVTCTGVTLDRIGASGGAGGTGGCGGSMGRGGAAGGSSIALLVLDSTVKLADVSLAAGKAGDGGKGGDGQKGGSKGTGGAFAKGAGTANDSCKGGDGGKGGAGGPGGGGQGGHSLGIAFMGTTPPSGITFTPDPLKKGSGGPGGLGNITANSGTGADGVSETCWDFGKDAICGQ
jgi:hypothetical protein